MNRYTRPNVIVHVLDRRVVLRRGELHALRA